MANILDDILKTKRKEVALLRTSTNIADARAMAGDAPEPKDFFKAVAGPPRGPVNLIAEIKKASPSAGVIRGDFDPPTIARQYALAGADALSVLTDGQYFQGSLDFLVEARAVVDIPLLRKDFIIDPLQIYEARCAGADAVLLIAAALGARELGDLLGLANAYGMACLVEVHNAEELSKVETIVVSAPGNLLGVNNRDLTTFKVDLDTTVRLADRIGGDIPVVSESGIKTRQDVETLAHAGVRAILVGETLMRSEDIAAGVESLLGPLRNNAPTDQ
ncbi:MAG: indole-3-glycerol phosphate synthase TrpC [Phycisphaerae bacterium]|jgi:indole-3-glycerol phosphate synthase|nr:indole-3-glycerol phosphate synthase TrpC [Phycisphaerae bacterium]